MEIEAPYALESHRLAPSYSSFNTKEFERILPTFSTLAYKDGLSAYLVLIFGMVVNLLLLTWGIAQPKLREMGWLVGQPTAQKKPESEVESLLDSGESKSSKASTRSSRGSNRRGSKKSRSKRNANNIWRSISANKSKASKGVAPKKAVGFNGLDLFKFFAMICMLCDHYAHFHLPTEVFFGMKNRTARAIGRTAGPMFYYAVGYLVKQRFRYKLWFFALFMVYSNERLKIGTHVVPYDSLTIAFTISSIINIAEYVHSRLPTVLKLNSQYKRLGFHLVSVFIISSTEANSYISNNMGMMYGTAPWLFGIGGYLLKIFVNEGLVEIVIPRLYILAGIYNFGTSSSSSFRFTGVDQYLFVGGQIIAFIWMCFLKLELPRWFWIPGPVKNFMHYVSRNAMMIYLSHLAVFRLAEVTRNGYRVW